MVQIIDIDPVPKPRMTQRDKWAKRPAVLRYRAFCDQIRLMVKEVPPAGSHVIFVMPMPKSFTNRKQLELLHQPHTQRPDLDNLVKALLDAVHAEDAHIWDLRASKIWGETGQIIIGDNAPFGYDSALFGQGQ